MESWGWGAWVGKEMGIGIDSDFLRVGRQVLVHIDLWIIYLYMCYLQSIAVSIKILRDSELIVCDIYAAFDDQPRRVAKLNQYSIAFATLTC